MTWQQKLLDHLRSALPDGGTAEAYGSAGAHPGDAGADLDGWSDLDVVIAFSGTAAVDVAALVGCPSWGWQESVDDGAQRLRLVLADGRRVDALVHGGRIRMPEPAADNAVRFDAALAAARLGRGNALIGTHLVLGVLREALVQVMLLVDAAEGTDHHRRGSELDGRAAEVGELLSSGTSSGPALARAAYDLYGRWRAELDPSYAPEPSGLDAVIARGTALQPPIERASSAGPRGTHQRNAPAR